MLIKAYIRICNLCSIVGTDPTTVSKDTLTVTFIIM